MSTTTKIPFLPGMQVTSVKPKPRKQFFAKSNGVAGETAGAARSGPKRQSQFATANLSAEAGGEEAVPAWVAFAGKALRFQAFFQEAVQESNAEHFRIRKVVITFFLEDDSVQVVESKQQNSGMPQGVLLRRHRIPRDVPDDPDDYWMADDFNVGEDVSFYGRTYHIVNCDEFTRKYLEKVGIAVGTPEDYPEDPYAKVRERSEGAQRRIGPPKPAVDKLKQFLEHDRNVLEFLAVWDEKRMFSERRFFKLHYFLADGSMQIVEVHNANSGRDQSGPMVRRQRVPKLKKGQSVLRTPTEGEVTYFSEKDLFVGETVHVLGRDFFLYDADPHTKIYYNEVYGVDFEPIDMSEPEEKPVERATPPYNGFGSEQDSLNSCGSLVPRVPKKDIVKMLADDKQLVRFAAKLVSNVAEDRERVFVVTYYMSDDTVGVFEQRVRNSGIMGGKFLERQQLRNVETGEYFKPADFYVGAKVTINAHQFLLSETDEFSIGVMENRTKEFPQADLKRVHERLRDALQGQDLSTIFASMDVSGDGVVSKDEFVDALLGANIATEQEVIHLARYYDQNGDGQISYAEFSAIVGSDEPVPVMNVSDINAAAAAAKEPVVPPEIVRDAFRVSIGKLDDALRSRKGTLLKSFREFDIDRDSKLSIAEFKAMIDAINIALSVEERDQLINHFFDDAQASSGKIGYQRFVTLLQRDPAAHVVLAGANAPAF